MKFQLLFIIEHWIILFAERCFYVTFLKCIKIVHIYSLLFIYTRVCVCVCVVVVIVTVGGYVCYSNYLNNLLKERTHVIFSLTEKVANSVTCGMKLFTRHKLVAQRPALKYFDAKVSEGIWNTINGSSIPRVWWLDSQRLQMFWQNGCGAATPQYWLTTIPFVGSASIEISISFNRYLLLCFVAHFIYIFL